MRVVELYSDGAVKDNQSDKNIGGYGGVLHYRGHEKEFSGSRINTTNNIMELTAVIEGLKLLKERDLRVEVYTDSAYVSNCFKQGWYRDWIRRGWMTSKKTPVENKELWQELIGLVESFDEVVFYKIKGHLSKESQTLDKWYKKFFEEEKKVSKEKFVEYISYNNRADQLASGAALEEGSHDK